MHVKHRGRSPSIVHQPIKRPNSPLRAAVSNVLDVIEKAPSVNIECRTGEPLRTTELYNPKIAFNSMRGKWFCCYGAHFFKIIRNKRFRRVYPASTEVYQTVNRAAGT